MMRVLTPRIEEKATIVKVSVETATEEGRGGGCSPERKPRVSLPTPLCFYTGPSETKKPRKRMFENRETSGDMNHYGCPEGTVGRRTAQFRQDAVDNRLSF